MTLPKPKARAPTCWHGQQQLQRNNNATTTQQQQHINSTITTKTTKSTGSCACYCYCLSFACVLFCFFFALCTYIHSNYICACVCMQPKRPLSCKVDWTAVCLSVCVCVCAAVGSLHLTTDIFAACRQHCSQQLAYTCNGHTHMHTNDNDKITVWRKMS